MARAAPMVFEGATLTGEMLLKLLCVHEYKVLHTSVEVNISVDYFVTLLST
jgi:hypothetical protein